MSSMIMRGRAIAVALVVGVIVAGVGLPVSAQRGGSGGRGGSAGHGGSAGRGSGSAGSSHGIAGLSAPAFHGSFAPTGRSNYRSGPQYRPSSGSRSFPSAAPTPNLRGARGPGNRYPVYSGAYRYRRPYVPLYGGAVLYNGPGYWSPSYVGYPDYDPYDYSDSAYSSPPPADYGDVGAYPNPPAEYGPQPSPDQATATPADSYRPAYVSPQAPEPLAPEEAVTLVFKDGRPSQQIHNYMLTRTTLFVLDGHRIEIPVDQLDLAATAKANRDAGVDFQLPGSGS